MLEISSKSQAAAVQFAGFVRECERSGREERGRAESPWGEGWDLKALAPPPWHMEAHLVQLLAYPFSSVT